MYEIDLDEGIADSCYNTDVPVVNPPPFAGYDARCRPWYQESMFKKVDSGVTMGEPYLFYSDNEVGLTMSYYFKLQGFSEKTTAQPLEGVLAMDLYQEDFVSEL